MTDNQFKQLVLVLTKDTWPNKLKGDHGNTAYKGPANATAMQQNCMCWPVMQHVFKHVCNFTPDFGIAQLLTVQFSNGLQQSGHSIGFPVICDPK